MSGCLIPLATVSRNKDRNVRNNRNAKNRPGQSHKEQNLRTFERRKRTSAPQCTTHEALLVVLIASTAPQGFHTHSKLGGPAPIWPRRAENERQRLRPARKLDSPWLGAVGCAPYLNATPSHMPALFAITRPIRAIHCLSTPSAQSTQSCYRLPHPRFLLAARDFPEPRLGVVPFAILCAGRTRSKKQCPRNGHSSTRHQPC